MSDKSPSGSSSISRPAGVLVSLATAAIVFGVGSAILPKPERPVPPPVAVAPPPPQVPTPPPPGDVTAGVGGAGGAGGVGGESGAAGGQAGATDAATPPEFADDAKAATPDAEARPSTDAEHPSAYNADGGDDTNPDCALADKDMAREAWRRNWPTICPIGDTGKGFILIPVKGPIQNAVVELKRKPVREARVSLPQAESQLTLKLYKLKKLGFKELRVGPVDEGADTGTRLRVRLMPGAGDPVFDVKDGYAKITVATPDKSEKPDKD